MAFRHRRRDWNRYLLRFLVRSTDAGLEIRGSRRELLLNAIGASRPRLGSAKLLFKKLINTALLPYGFVPSYLYLYITRINETFMYQVSFLPINS